LNASQTCLPWWPSSCTTPGQCPKSQGKTSNLSQYLSVRERIPLHHSWTIMPSLPAAIQWTKA
jgi:hypothetical protein